MKSSITSCRGETLIEVLLALMILITGAAGSLQLLGIASVNNQLAKERVIATNLAREGIEAIRNIRDTNWLRFAGERRLCWNNNDLSKCDGSSPIEHQKSYLAKFDSANHRWELDVLDPNIPLELSDGVGSNDEKYRLKISSSGLYNSSGIGDDSFYFREIYTEYVADDGNSNPPITRDGSTCSGIPDCANALRVISKVEWYDRGKISDVILTTVLTDYLSRKNHE